MNTLVQLRHQINVSKYKQHKGPGGYHTVAANGGWSPCVAATMEQQTQRMVIVAV
jgi:hypothetical protein